MLLHSLQHPVELSFVVLLCHWIWPAGFSHTVTNVFESTLELTFGFC